MFDPKPVLAQRMHARAVGAVWVSAAVHVAIALSIAWIAREKTGTQDAATVRVAISPPVIWVRSEGDPGGGGSHGDGRNAPTSSAQRPGADPITVPARVARTLSSKVVDQPALQEIDIPALPEASGVHEMPGVVTALSTANASAAGPRTGRGSGEGDGDGLNPGTGRNWGGGPPGSGAPASSPELIRQVRPNYTTSALQARLRGVVVMDAIVLPDGSVGEVKIVRSLDPTFGLDQEAIKAVKQWRFRPAARGGQPIAMLVSVEMMFELR